MSRGAIAAVITVGVIGIVGFGFWYTAPTSEDDVGEKVGEALDTTGDYFKDKFSFSEKDAFVADAREKLDALKAKASELKKSAGAASEESMDEIEAKIDALEEKLAEAKDATAETWDEMKAGFASEYSDAKETFQSH